ncbi:hypothetical protein Tco_1104177 [Tanacetum coccineum]
MPNTRSGASMTREEFKELVNRRVAEEMKAREAARTLEPLNENGDEQEGKNRGNGNRGNRNGGNGENRNGNRNGNHGMNYGGFKIDVENSRFWQISFIRSRDFQELVEKVQNKVNDWKNEFLSFMGRLQLIQSVLSFMHVYWASCFILTARIILDIEQHMRGFLWCQGEMRKGKAKVAWALACSFLRVKDFLAHGNMSWGWRKLHQVRLIIRHFFWYKLGDGKTKSL